MAGKAKSIFKAMVIINILILFSCFTLASKAQSAGVSCNEDDTALVLAEYLFSISQEQSPLEKIVANIYCTFDSIIDLINAITACEENIWCNRSAVLAEIIDLVECINQDKENLLFVACNITTIHDAVEAVLTCEDNVPCIVSNVLAMLMDFIDCVDVGIGSGPGEMTSTGN
jgi:hypothetical protein